jgi:hypothetical protein
LERKIGFAQALPIAGDAPLIPSYEQNRRMIPPTVFVLNF